ncbi:unnamed protein product [Lathyrus sativus]|nr:unnamed protein product [Lathyrus sativus]
MEVFDDFISKVDLVDLPLKGRCFTWSKLDGSSMSRVDRFLVSEGWMHQWPNRVQICLEKSIYDHCPIIICDKEVNWGPKPFHMIKCWRDLKGYHNVVEESWRPLEIQGRGGGYVLNEKFKLIKGNLK